MSDDPVEIGKAALIEAYGRAKTYDDPLNFTRIMRAVFAALESRGYRIVGPEPVNAMLLAADDAALAEYRDHPKWDEAKTVIEEIDMAHILRDALAAAPTWGGKHDPE